MSKLDRRDWAIVLGITALAAVLRFYKLGAVPPGFQFDEAYNALDAARVLAGDRPLFLPDNGGREVLYTYLQVALASFLGLNLFTLRLTSALAGIVTVPASYLLVRTLLTRDSRHIAAFTSITLAISFWHLHFSHYGIRIILMPLIFSGVVGFFWLGTRPGNAAHAARHRTASLIGTAWPFVLSGILAGLSVWNNPTGRLIPIILLGYVLWLLWQHPELRTLRWPNPVAGLLLTGLVAFIVFLPLGLEFYRHPDFFLGHPGQVSVLAERVHGGSPVLATARNALRVLGMFSIQGDREWIHNLAGRPVFDPLLSIPFVIGVAVWARRLTSRGDPDRDALVLLLLWTLVMLLPSILSDAAPNFSRSLPTLPALFVATGLGLAWLLAFVGRRWSRRVAWAVISVILAASTVWAMVDYFFRFPRTPEAYYAYDVDKLDAWATLEPLAADGPVYLSQLWAEHATLDFLRRDSNVKSLDTSDTVVLPPPGQSAAYAFPAEQADRARRLQALWPEAALQTVPDAQGNPLLVFLKVAAGDVALAGATQSPSADFVEGPALVGMAYEPAGNEITLIWQAQQPMNRSLTSFVHLIDSSGRRIGQIDKLPGNGSYPTAAWSPGEQVIERYRLAVDPCSGGQEARVVTGWYDNAGAAETAPLPRSDGSGNVALAGRITLPLVSLPPDRVQLQTLPDTSLPGDLKLTGFELAGDVSEPGAPFTLDLAWEGDPDMASTDLTIRLESENDGDLLWDGATLPPDALWKADERICRRYNLNMPRSAQPGPHRLVAEVAGTPILLAELDLKPSTRRFDAPPVAHSVNVNLDDQFLLLGYELVTPRSEDTLPLRLVWQATTRPQTGYTAFVHLLDGDGRIVAQADAVPGDGYATDRWLNGEVVVDTHMLTLPNDLLPGTYRLVAGMYDPLDGRRLPAWDTGGQPVQDGAIPLGGVTLP